ncbi:hypothetical protein R1flu_011355 [Riccia fluitans]|uniref:EF-hand domain-containing protein n=1 Tax=Riccia fluitans TaxID=41844 RepID=A0ABD1Z7K0_9MARC
MFRPSFSAATGVAKRLRFHNVLHKKDKLPAPVRYLHPYSELSSPSVDSTSSSTGTDRIHHSSRCSGNSRAFADTLMEQQRQQLVQAFGIIDKNRDGEKIFSRGAERALWRICSPARFRRRSFELWVQQRVDVDGDGNRSAGVHELSTRETRLGPTRLY